MSLRLAIDTGGTFTDLVVEEAGRELRFYKRPTTPANPIEGLLDVLGSAATERALSLPELLGRAELLIFGTTRATNAVVTGTTARTALLCTEGHPDVLLFREGGGRRSLFDYTQEFPQPYIPRSLTFEVPERILSDGSVQRPLDEEAVRALVAELLRRDVEAVAVCLLWSTVNPVHETRVGEILATAAPTLPVTLSHVLNPSLREYRRASSAAIDASLKPLMSAFLAELETTLAHSGFSGRLLVMTSSGGVLDAAEVARQPIHSIGSGPAAAPVAGRHYARLDATSADVLVTDAGGTTYDVSLVRRDRIPRTRETIVGDPSSGFITGFPSIDVRSVGAGGGSIAWVDAGGLLHVGPQSAGAEPGPACYGRGGAKATVTDACVVLGYLEPTSFLGGEMPIQAALAEEAIERDVARPLGLGLDEAAGTTYAVAVERMVGAIEGITLKQGIDPAGAVMIGGGGGSGLYSDAIARRLGIARVIIPDIAGTLSAAGELLSDLQATFTSVAVISTARPEAARVRGVIEALGARCDEFAARACAGGGTVDVRYSVEARYRHQVWEIEVPLERPWLAEAEEIAGFCADFHAAHEDLFAVRDERAPIEIVSWHAHVRCALREKPPERAHAGFHDPARAAHRRAWIGGLGRVETPVRTLAEFEPCVRVPGPLLVDSPATSVVVGAGSAVTLLPSGSLLLEPRPADG